jgi:hypothetical protein
VGVLLAIRWWKKDDFTIPEKATVLLAPQAGSPSG